MLKVCSKVEGKSRRKRAAVLGEGGGGGRWRRGEMNERGKHSGGGGELRGKGAAWILRRVCTRILPFP